jgi:hypothetical protein
VPVLCSAGEILIHHPQRVLWNGEWFSARFTGNHLIPRNGSNSTKNVLNHESHSHLATGPQQHYLFLRQRMLQNNRIPNCNPWISSDIHIVSNQNLFVRDTRRQIDEYQE